MGKAIILELKIADKFSDMKEKCREALQQIETKSYEQELLEEGCQEIVKYGICFLKKGCIVLKAEN